MKNLALVPFLVVALGACADRPDPVAPETMNADMQMSWLWFVSDPPVPAVVGDTYDVVVQGDGSDWRDVGVDSLTPSVCSLQGTFDEMTYEWLGTATFLAAGECHLRATQGTRQADQIFDVFESNAPAPHLRACMGPRSGRVIWIPRDNSCPSLG
jgi:hypothetical protein